jgi:site-specific DNA-methyltransferase (adenine-specific)
MDLLNKVVNGDCISVMKNLPDKCIDLIVTDPPYLISYKTNYRNDKMHEFTTEIANDDNPELIKEYIKECFRILKDNSAMYMFCSTTKIDFFKQELEKYFTIKNQIIWVKNNWTAGDLEAAFGRQYEICFLVNKGRKKFNGKRLTDIWYFDRIVGKNQVHQNQKPVDLIQRCIEKHSNVGDIIFDGFGGSGTTAVAAVSLKRNFIIIEYEEKYCNIISERLGSGDYIIRMKDINGYTSVKVT